MRVALGTVFLLLVLAPAAGSTTASTASLRVVDTSPFTVHGWRFQPNERVLVTVAAKETRSRTISAGPSGTFTVRFVSLRLGECDLYRVRAVGDEGSQAVLKPAPPQCGTYLQP